MTFAFTKVDASCRMPQDRMISRISEDHYVSFSTIFASWIWVPSKGEIKCVSWQKFKLFSQISPINLSDNIIYRWIKTK